MKDCKKFKIFALLCNTISKKSRKESKQKNLLDFLSYKSVFY